MQEHEEQSTATLCPFLYPTSEECLQHRCLQIFSLHRLAHGQVQSGYWQPIQHSITQSHTLQQLQRECQKKLNN